VISAKKPVISAKKPVTNVKKMVMGIEFNCLPFYSGVRGIIVKYLQKKATYVRMICMSPSGVMVYGFYNE